MNEQKLNEVYEMVDNVPFSKQKKNISRDFSDALMMAELIHHYYPQKVELHNYPSTNAVSKKITNWNTLNSKVLKKIGLHVTRQEIEAIANSKPMAIEQLLYRFLVKFERPEEEMKLSHRFENAHEEKNQKYPYSSNEKNRKNQKSLQVPLRGFEKSSEFNNPYADVMTKRNEDTEEVLDLIDKIDYAYAQLLKLQEMSALKDDLIKNLEKKVEKVIFD